MPERHLTIPSDLELAKLKSQSHRLAIRSATEAVSAIGLIPLTGIMHSMIDNAASPNLLLPSLSVLAFAGFSSLAIKSYSDAVNASSASKAYRSGTLLKQGVETKYASSDVSSEAVAARICQLPPVGAKIATSGTGYWGIKRLPPYLLAEQLVPDLISKTKRVSTQDDFIVQQLTVQGRAQDDFKFVALMLLMHSDNLYDWDQPGYETPWGRVAPMIHDGGNTDYSLNPVIQARLPGRTDFLSRIVFADQVQDETSLLTDVKAWQRLKLAHDARPFYKNPYLDDGSELANKLNVTWKGFTKETSQFIKDCQLGELLEVRWFEPEPRNLPAINNYGDRYEADFDKIRPGLIKLNDMMERYPDQLKQRSAHILTKYTNRVDAILGI